MATRTWGMETTVNAAVAGDQFGAEVAALAGGGFVVVWKDSSANPAAPSVRARRYDALGQAVGDEIEITGATMGPSGIGVAAQANGGFYVVTSEFFGFGSAFLQGRVYAADGSFLRQQVLTTELSNNIDPVLARGGQTTAAVWQRNGGTGGVRLRLFDPAGTASGVVELSTAAQAEPTVAVSQVSGLTAAAWVMGMGASGGSSIRVRAFPPNSTTQAGSDVVILAPAGGFVRAPQLAWLSSGMLAVAWEERTVLSPTQQEVSARMTLVRPVNIGTPAPEMQVVVPDGITLVPSDVAEIRLLGLTALPGGGMVALWRDAVPDVYGELWLRLQAFDKAGRPVGQEYRVADVTGGANAPAVAALADGRVVVTWTHDAGAEDGLDVAMQIVDPRQGSVTGSALADTLYGHDLVGDEISGYGGNDTLYGLKGDDALYGGDGDDLLDGGAGADDMFGGRGNDTYVLDQSGDTVFEAWNQGTDTIRSAVVSIALSQFANVENATLTGSLELSATGTAGANVLDGAQNSAQNVLQGLAGNDTYIVGANDLVDEAAGAGTDTVQTAAFNIDLMILPNIENATLTGTLALTARGNSGDNVLNGALNSAANVLTGLGGNDTYIVAGKDTIVEAAGGGTDTVQSADQNLNLANYPNVENATLLGAAALSATGTAGANVLDGMQNSAPNKLIGLGGDDTYWVGLLDTVVEAPGGGRDIIQSSLIDITLFAHPNVEWIILRGSLALTAEGDDAANIIDGSLNSAANKLIGQHGNDTYVVGPGDTIVESLAGGVDQVQSWAISLDLAAYKNVENAALTGSQPLSITGSAGDNVLNGAGNGAANLLTGLGGNDTYILGPGDTAVEAAGGGTDTVQSAVVSLDLSATPHIENATLTGSLALNATGNKGANVLTGNAGANQLTGNGGGDTLIGLGGKDTLVGGSGTDMFRFLAPSDSAVGANRDVVLAFEGALGDRIDLSAIDADTLIALDQAFTWRGTSAFTGARGELRYDVAGPDVIVQGTLSGAAVAFEIRVAGVTALGAGDFKL